MLSCRGVADGDGMDIGGFLMLLLLNDAGIARGASPKTAVHQQMMQIDKRRDRDARRPDLHAGARDRIEHPRGDYRDYAGCHLDVNDRTAGTLLDVLSAQSSTKKWVPAVVDDDFMPDMGRMSG
jgi:hypothetical protein